MALYSEITIEQYADFSTTIDVLDLEGDPMDLSDHTPFAQMRKSPYTSFGESFDVSVNPNVQGELIMTLSSANTANLIPGRYLYDVIVVDSNQYVTRVVEGIVTVTPGITR